MNDMVLPAPGCPEKFLTETNAAEFCKKLDPTECKSSNACHPPDGLGCVPNIGTFVPDVVGATNATALHPLIELFLASDEPILAKADAYAAKRRFEKAISLYSLILQGNPEHPSVIQRRASAMDGAGRKDVALAEYCRVLLFNVNEVLASAARQRIAHLSGMQSGDFSGSFPATVAPTVPGTGDLIPRRQRDRIAPFDVTTGPGNNYLLKLVSIENSENQIWIFIRGGATYATKVPLGIYTLRIASGDTWFDRDNLFGPNTRFFRLRAKRGAAEVSIERLQFSRIRVSRTQISIRGVKIDLRGTVDGNLEQETMTRKDFDAK